MSRISHNLRMGILFFFILSSNIYFWELNIDEISSNGEIKLSEQPINSSEWYSEYDEYVRNVFVYENTVFVTDLNLGLRCFDNSDPLNLIEIGSLFIKDSNGIYVEDNIAYVACGRSDLRIINVSDPSNPFEIGSINNSNEPKYDSSPLFYLNKTIFLIADGLRIINVSDPTNPIEIGYIPSLHSREFAISGDILYTTDWPSKLILIDISDLANPVYIGDFDFDGYMNGVAVSGNLIYITLGSYGVMCLNISDPLNPIEISSESSISGYNADKIILIEDVAYVSEGFRLKIINYDDPLNPYAIGTKSYTKLNQTDNLLYTYQINDFFILNDILYFAASEFGLFTMNISIENLERLPLAVDPWTGLFAAGISLLVFTIIVISFYIVRRRRRPKIKKRRLNMTERIIKLSSLLKKSKSMKIDSVITLLDMTYGEFFNLLVKSQSELSGIRIKGENLYLESTDDIDRFTKFLDNQFESWKNKEKSKVGKII